MRPEGQRPILKWLLFISVLSLMTACGADDGSSYTPTVDVVETSAEITFDIQDKLIEIAVAGKPAESEIIPTCVISFEKTELSYAMPSATELDLGGDTLNFLRASDVVSHVNGVPDAIFAVWSVPTEVVDGISYKIEVEIQSDTIIYRNTCSR